jgi:hypothetical protein
VRGILCRRGEKFAVPHLGLAFSGTITAVVVFGMVQQCLLNTLVKADLNISWALFGVQHGSSSPG